MISRERSNFSKNITCPAGNNDIIYAKVNPDIYTRCRMESRVQLFTARFLTFAITDLQKCRCAVLEKNGAWV